MNYKKVVLTLMNESHAVIFIVEIKNNAPRSTKANFLKLPIGVYLEFYTGRYANDTTVETIISDILKRLKIDKKFGYYFIREEYSE